MSGGHNAEKNSTDWAIQARSRLARRRAEKRATKAAKSARYGQILKPPFAAGQSMKTVCAWLAKDAGITLGLSSLTSYVSRIRRRESIKSEAGVAGGQVSARWPGLSSLIGCGLWR